MINTIDRKKIINKAKSYGVTKIYIFGSVLNNPENANDIDIAVEGLPPELYYKFWAELDLSKEPDVVRLDDDYFSNLIKEEGKIIYEKNPRND